MSRKKQDPVSRMLDGRRAADNVNRLTLVFARAVSRAQNDKSDNLVVSPYNALTLMSMVAKGAGGETREEMARTLFADGSSRLNGNVQALADLNKVILESNRDSVTLKTANGIWVNKDMAALKKSYAAQTRRIFGAEIENRDFHDPALVGEINAWADKNTNGLIDHIVEELPADAYSLLASALYFKGDWTRKFDKALTDDKNFTTDSGGKGDIPTMHMDFQGKDRVNYLEGDDYEAVSFSFGENKPEERKRPTMRLLLVRPKDDAQTARQWLEAQADGKESPVWLSSYEYEEARGQVELPRVAVKQKHDLTQVLQDMGIRQAFSDAADFSAMTSDEVKISKAVQDVVFKFDEEGGEAASVTHVIIAKLTAVGSRHPERVIDLKFDRSFVFALQDVATNAVLFVGAVNQPNKDEALMPKKSGLLDGEGKPIAPKMV